MDLAFTLPTAAITFICVMLMGILIGDGHSHWLKGVQLLSLFTIVFIIGMGIWFRRFFTKQIEAEEARNPR